MVPPVGIEPTTRGFSVLCSTNWATEADRWILLRKWRLGWGSNPRPLAWQASALTNWATKPFSKKEIKISWWKVQGSNLWPSACKADALPTELTFRTPLLYQIKSDLSRGGEKKVLRNVRKRTERANLLLQILEKAGVLLKNIKKTHFCWHFFVKVL